MAELTLIELVQQRSMLIILGAACRSAQTTFENADGAIDDALRADLARVIERSDAELVKLSRQIDRAA